MDARQPDARFEALVREYGRLIRHAIRRAARADAPRLADDIEQAVLVSLWQQVAREQVIDHPASYVYRAAVRETVRAIRRDRSQSARAEPASPRMELVATGTTPDDDVRRREQRQALRASLETLAPDRARAVKAHLAGFSVEEIMALCGWPYQRARNLIARGMADLRLALRERGMS
ncbi:RNA polymerase sigma factor [Luteitalea sp.]|jgi:RNA polymerase sigma factor (sigma-70 family)|uniref:RNA polymerase sigma factor n=1 Tax=Luteitalea sp. TaxID=2004800 RepID=UPI0037CC8B3C